MLIFMRVAVRAGAVIPLSEKSERISYWGLRCLFIKAGQILHTNEPRAGCEEIKSWIPGMGDCKVAFSNGFCQEFSLPDIPPLCKTGLECLWKELEQQQCHDVSSESRNFSAEKTSRENPHRRSIINDKRERRLSFSLRERFTIGAINLWTTFPPPPKKLLQLRYSLASKRCSAVFDEALGLQMIT